MTNENDHGIRFGRIAAMLPVRDIGKAEAFYTRVLGFRKTFENGDPVGFMILKRDDAELHLTLQKTHEAAPFNVAHLLVDDVDELHGICRREGLRIIKGLRDHDYGLRAFVFADPDGNRIDVGQAM
ncbi:glyoxalase superfamily protein [Bosea sp. PAMC 26642]|uniref:glyoxalase superfamily protein n=1 Tax=Bosea sp. (strain PAMC 26642) TaxID=1792307 RepID=UPI0007701CA9|nr:glyoxalase superfamily protein [Bosea sp. PAMC 26642]AMJ62345.1 glyoxalase [Bosea sp. PAMC 26642]